MKKFMILGMALACTFVLSSCAVNAPQKEEEVEVFPQNRDAAAQFLASNERESWVLLLQDDGAGNAILANPERIDQQAGGVNAIWLKMLFPQPIPLSVQNPAPVVGTLMYTEVKCSDNTYRTSTYYAVSQNGDLLEITANEQAAFIPLDSGAVALSIYHLTCER